MLLEVGYGLEIGIEVTCEHGYHSLQQLMALLRVLIPNSADYHCQPHQDIRVAVLEFPLFYLSRQHLVDDLVCKFVHESLSVLADLAETQG